MQLLPDNLINAFKQYGSVTTDTRKLQEGDIYFALKGENFNGNEFALPAIQSGASYAVIDEPQTAGEHEKFIIVENALETLQQLALHYRRSFSIPFIGITGSNGKTTTKELIHAVLSSEKKVFATRGNLNNHIGVPLTLLSLPKDLDIAVIEMGANKPGDIKELVEICEATIGMITNIGRAHLEQLGGLEGVAKTKGELFDFIRNTHGTAWVNGMDHRVVERSAGIEKRVFYGTPEAEYQIAELAFHADSTDLVITGPPFPDGIRVTTRLVGEHNAHNVLAAVLAGGEMGISPEGIQRGIRDYIPKMNRTEMVRTDRFLIMMDAYNANPSSMRAAIKAVFDLKYGKTALVLGDMFEMGEESPEIHRELGEFISSFPAGIVIGIGKDMKQTIDAVKGAPGVWFPDTESARQGIAGYLDGIEFILLKGSRGMALEKLMDQFGEVQE